MGIFKKSDDRIIYESQLYEMVAAEISAGEIHSGLWTKATAEARSSDEMDIEAVYIKLRAEYLEAEHRVGVRVTKQVQKNQKASTNYRNDPPRQSKPKEKMKLSEFFFGAGMIFVLILLILISLGHSF